MNTNLRHISYCLIASLLFVACRKESHPLTPEEPEEQYAISMNAASVADMTTSRALVTDDADLQGTNLGVFAYKTIPGSSDPIPVFTNTKVVYDTDTKAWTYDNTKYWDRTAHYYFVSYSPHQESDVTFENEQLKISNIPNWQPIDGDAKDYLIANDHNVAEGGYITPNGVQPVPLAFKHILCQLEVRVLKNPFLMNTYTLSGISYGNVPVKEGANATTTYTYTAPVDETVGESAGYASEISNVPILMASPNAVIPSDPEQVAATTLKHLVVPFNGNFSITLNYNINGIPAAPATVDTQLDELESNNRYVLTLTFNSGAEIIPTLQILGWEEVDVDEDDKYNW